MATRRIEVIIGGNASAAQKAFRDTEQSATKAQVKVEGFGKAFAKLGLALGAAALLKQAASGIAEYASAVQSAEARIRGFTGSQQQLAAAQALANKEQQRGRGAYSETLTALADLTPLTNKYNLNLEDVLHTAQLLAATDPVQGFEGAKIALQEALSGDFTSLARRFELPKNAIQELKDQGVPNLLIVQKVMGDLGITEKLLDEQAKTAAFQQKLLADNIAKLGTESGKSGLDVYTTALIGLNKAAQSGAIKEFAAGLRELIEVGVSGKGWEDFAISARKSIYLILDAFNNLLEATSFGKISLDKPLAEMRASIVADEAKLRAAVQQGIAQPVADELSGKGSGSPIASAKVEGYGRAVIENFVKGASSAQVGQLSDLQKLIPDSIKAGTTDFAAATADLAQALAEVAQTGQISETTLYRLSTVFGKGTSDIAAQIVAMGQLTAATERHEAAVQALADAEANLQQVQNRAKGDLAGYEAAITSATQAAQANADASSAAVEGLQDALDGVRDAAEASARAGAAVIEGLQGELDGLQNAASQHQAANQAAIAQAQAALSAASQQRQNDQALLNAALAGELEYEEQILDGLTDQQRAIAAKWQAEIDGQRRARDGANQKVTNLNRAAHKEDLDFLTKIDAARAAGNEKEARRLERELAARQKQRQAATQLAQAQAAVADDEFDAAEERIKKEGKDQEVKDTQAERAAQANLDRVQAAAKAQADADAAAIKGKQDEIKQVQAAQKAEADRYAAQQRGIQAEIERINDAAKAQAKKDKDAITAAQIALDNRQAYWNVETTGAQAAVNLTGALASGWERAEKAAKDLLDHITKIADILKNNPAISNPQPAKPPTQTSPYDETPPYVPPAANPAARPVPATNTKPPVFDPATAPGGPPPGYHAETAYDGKVYYIKDGYHLEDYGVAQGTPAPSTGGPGGLSNVPAPLGGEFASAGGPAFLRASGLAGQGAPGGGTTIIISAPNLRDIRDKRDLADLGAHLERTWKDIARGGRVKREA